MIQNIPLSMDGEIVSSLFTNPDSPVRICPGLPNSMIAFCSKPAQMHAMADYVASSESLYKMVAVTAAILEIIEDAFRQHDEPLRFWYKGLPQSMDNMDSQVEILREVPAELGHRAQKDPDWEC